MLELLARKRCSPKAVSLACALKANSNSGLRPRSHRLAPQSKAQFRSCHPSSPTRRVQLRGARIEAVLVDRGSLSDSQLYRLGPLLQNRQFSYIGLAAIAVDESRSAFPHPKRSASFAIFQFHANFIFSGIVAFVFHCPFPIRWFFNW